MDNQQHSGWMAMAPNVEPNGLVFEGVGLQSHRDSCRQSPSRCLWIKVAMTLVFVIATVASVVLFFGKPFTYVADLHHTIDFHGMFQDPDLILVKASYGAWAAGKFTGTNAIQEARKFFSEDIVIDASAPMENTDIMKIYRGVDGLLDWCNQLKVFEFKDFAPNFFFVGSGKVFMQETYTPIVISTGSTGPKMSDTMVYTVRDGKISRLTFYWGNAAGIDALFDAEAPLAVLKGSYAAWGAGKYSGSNAYQEMAKFLDRGIVLDASADMTNTDIYKVYHGFDGAAEWTKNLDQFQFNNFLPVMVQGPPGVVYMYVTYTATVKATGKTGPKMQDMQAWTVRNGKIVKGKFFWGNPKGLDALYVK